MNEGFATYFASLYIQASHGPEEFAREIAMQGRTAISEDHLAPRPVVFDYYQGDAMFYFDGLTYQKGSRILHMLRNLLGDTSFFAGIQHYLQKNQNQLVGTDDFRQAMEESSGQDLGWFFDQWLYKPGHPIFEMRWSYDAASKTLNIHSHQVQDRSGAGDFSGGKFGKIPLFRGALPIEIDGRAATLAIENKDAEQDFKIPVDQTPNYVAFNAGNVWLAEVKISSQDEKSLRAQLEGSHDLATQISAADRLGGSWQDGEKGGSQISQRLDALQACAKNQTSAWVRATCLQGVIHILEADKLAPALVNMPLLGKTYSQDDEPRVREAVVGLVRSLPKENRVDYLKHILDTETSQRVKSQVVSELNQINQPDAMELILKELEKPTYDEKFQANSLGSLGDFDDPKILDLAISYLASDHADGARESALWLMVDFAKNRRSKDAKGWDRVRILIESQLKDPSISIRSSAVRALQQLNDTKSIVALDYVQTEDLSGEVRQIAKDAIAALSS